MFALLGVLTLQKYSLFFRKYLSKLGLFRAMDVRYLLVITSRRVQAKKVPYFRQKKLQETIGLLNVSKKSSLEILLNLEISWIKDILFFWSNTVFIQLYPLFAVQMVQKFCGISKFLYNDRIFEEKSVFEKKVVIFTFSRPLIAKLDNVVS